MGHGQVVRQAVICRRQTIGSAPAGWCFLQAEYGSGHRYRLQGQFVGCVMIDILFEGSLSCDPINDLDVPDLWLDL